MIMMFTFLLAGPSGFNPLLGGKAEELPRKVQKIP
jgi:hypothetical protein